jgi:uncharacterized membrane protein
MEVIISNVLKIGVLISAAFLIIGLSMLILTGDTSCPTGDMSLEWFISGLGAVTPSHIIFTGFLILVSTPILRIAASVMIYLQQRDYAFAAITGIVLAVMLYSLTMGIG